MDLFIDTANIDQIKKAQSLGILNGVTTNPSLMYKEGIAKDKIKDHYLKICNIVDGPVSAEVISTNYEGIIKEGTELSAIHPQIVVKVPMIEEGIKAIVYFQKNNIKTNCTLIFTLAQAIIAAKAGATYVSPFIGRLEDNGENGIQLIEEIAQVYNYHHFKTKILGASIRNTDHIVNCCKAGAHSITAPLNNLIELFHHPLTDKGLSKFLEDYNKK
jgi:transaldolase